MRQRLNETEYVEIVIVLFFKRRITNKCILNKVVTLLSNESILWLSLS